MKQSETTKVTLVLRLKAFSFGTDQKIRIDNKSRRDVSFGYCQCEITMWKSLKYDSSFVQFSKAIFKHRNPPAVGKIYFQLSLIQGKAEIDKFKFEGTCVKVPNSTMLSIVDVQSEFYQFVFHQWDSRCEPVGSERRLLIRFSSSPLQGCSTTSARSAIDLLAILERIKIERYFATICRTFDCAQ